MPVGGEIEVDQVRRMFADIPADVESHAAKSRCAAHVTDHFVRVGWRLGSGRVGRLGLLLLAGAGAALAYSGALLQGVFRNGLASPSILGITAGAIFAGNRTAACR